MAFKDPNPDPKTAHRRQESFVRQIHPVSEARKTHRFSSSPAEPACGAASAELQKSESASATAASRNRVTTRIAMCRRRGRNGELLNCWGLPLYRAFGRRRVLGLIGMLQQIRFPGSKSHIKWQSRG